MEIEYIPLTQIDEPVDPARIVVNQKPLQELVDSIDKRGLLQPILLKRSGDRYEIEAGHRRYLAMKHLGWDCAPCIVKGTVEDKDMHLDRAHENLIRENMSVIEESKMVNSLINENGRGIEETERLINRSRKWIEDRLEILEYPDELVTALINKEVPLSVAKEISKCKNEELRKKTLEYVIETGAKAAIVKRWITDSTVEQLSEAIDSSRATGEVQQIDLGKTYMQCGICIGQFETEHLRHVFLCPTCLEGIRQIREQCIKEATQEARNEE